MVGGFNTNVRYRGRTFHVQTEDSGPSRPHIVTLVYEGGTILHSKKQSYAKAEGTGADAVRDRMESQHREVVRDLKSGALDGPLGLSPGRVLEFGDGIVTDRSLCEVILSHLAA
ncbi:MAG: hypothetical protein ACE5IL_06045 [Myxococcota bacterium]